MRWCQRVKTLDRGEHNVDVGRHSLRGPLVATGGPNHACTWPAMGRGLSERPGGS